MARTLFGQRMTFEEIGSGSCAATTKSQLLPQVSMLTEFIAVLKLTVAFRKVRIQDCSELRLGKMTSTSSSSSEDEEASERDSKNFDNWIMEAGDVEDPTIPPVLTIPVVQPVTTNNPNNQFETAPTPNDVGIAIQPATCYCIRYHSYQQSDCRLSSHLIHIQLYSLS